TPDPARREISAGSFGLGCGQRGTDGQLTDPASRPLWELPHGQTSAGRGRTGDRARAGRGRGRRRPAEQWPIGRVLVDVSLAHLDRTFDYRVPEQLDTAAVPGVRVRVRFAGQLVDGFLLERAASSEHQGRIAFLERVTSS